jgi:hypothetical protein
MRANYWRVSLFARAFRLFQCGGIGCREALPGAESSAYIVISSSRMLLLGLNAQLRSPSEPDKSKSKTGIR